MAEVVKFVEKFSVAHQLTAIITPSTVSMISSDDICFVCGQTGHFVCNSPDVQCYGYDKTGDFAQDCSHKLPPPCHHGISHSRYHTTTNRGTDPTPIMVPDIADITA